jgi:hypothetical protein
LAVAWLSFLGSIFFVNVPVCLVAVIIGARTILGPSRLKLPKRAWIVQATLLPGYTS